MAAGNHLSLEGEAAYAIGEDFIKGKKATRFEDAVQIRVRRKFKFVDRFKFAVTYGKMIGHITDEPQETDDAFKCLKVVFVNSKGEPVDVDFMRSPTPARVIEHDPQSNGVKFVR